MSLGYFFGRFEMKLKGMEEEEGVPCAGLWRGAVARGFEGEGGIGVHWDGGDGGTFRSRERQG